MQPQSPEPPEAGDASQGAGQDGETRLSDRGPPGRGPGAPNPPPREPGHAWPGRGRVRRILLAAATFLLALLVVLVAIPPLREAAVALFTGPTPTPSATPPPSEMTATAEAVSFLALERRPLHLPTLTPGAPCPKTGDQNGPVYNFQAAELSSGAAPTRPGGWGPNEVDWRIRPPYQGPVLIRGHQIDGPHDLRFTGGLDELKDPLFAPLLPALRILGGPGYWWPHSDWPSYTYIQAPGCYAYQVDGLTFSYSVVFEAMPAAGGGG